MTSLQPAQPATVRNTHWYLFSTQPLWLGGIGLVTSGLLVRLLAPGAPPGNNPAQVVHTRAIVHQAVWFGTGQRAVTLRNWKGNRSPTSHWPCVTDSVVYPPIRAQSLDLSVTCRNGDEHPVYALCGLTFYLILNTLSKHYPFVWPHTPQSELHRATCRYVSAVSCVLRVSHIVRSVS